MIVGQPQAGGGLDVKPPGQFRVRILGMLLLLLAGPWLAGEFHNKPSKESQGCGVMAIIVISRFPGP